MDPAENQNTEINKITETRKKANKPAIIAAIIAGLMTITAAVFAVLFFTKPAAEVVGENSSNPSDSPSSQTPSTPSAPSERPDEPQPDHSAESILARPFLFLSDNILNEGENEMEYEIARFGNMDIYIDGSEVEFYLPGNSAYIDDLEYIIGTRDDFHDAHTISFSQPVASAECLGFGQAGGLETLFFVMADGTVEYMPVVDAYANQKYESYGKVPGVENIVTLSAAGAFSIGHGSGAGTTLAFRSDGKFYDLAIALDIFNNSYYPF